MNTVSTIQLEYHVELDGLEALNCDWWDCLAAWTVADDIGTQSMPADGHKESGELVTVTVSFSVPDPAELPAEASLSADAEGNFQFDPLWLFAFTHSIARRQYPQP